MSDKLITFEKLEVFQKAYKVSIKLHKITKKFPRDERFSLTDQIRRASKSVCANIVEGCAKQFYSKAEFKRYVLIALRSSDEMRLWCRYCYDLELIDNKEWRELSGEYSEISKMLTGLHKHLSK
jgi:four helix bundle protein